MFAPLSGHVLAKFTSFELNSIRRMCYRIDELVNQTCFVRRLSRRAATRQSTGNIFLEFYPEQRLSYCKPEEFGGMRPPPHTGLSSVET